LEPALCGREPSLPWTRIWIDHVDDLGRVTGCAGCKAAFEQRMVRARGAQSTGDPDAGSPALYFSRDS
jgi:hypothetical protein